MNNTASSREQCDKFFCGKSRRGFGARNIIFFLIAAISLIAPATVSLAGPVPAQLLSARDSSVIPPAGGDGDSCGAVVSPDGRFVVFSSAANDLVPENDRQFYLNVFLRDRASNTTVMASVSLDGTNGGNANSLYGQVSTNGQFVLFESWANNLVAGATNWIGDIYVRDMLSGTNILVSTPANGAGTQANGRSYDAVMTPDGRYVAFVSEASNLVPGDSNGIPDVFLRDIMAGTNTLVSAGATGSGATMATPQITPDGHYVAFFSTAKGMASGAGANGEIYIRDCWGETTTWASVDASNIVKSAFGTSVSTIVSCAPRLSDDGQFVVFKSGGTSVTGRTAILGYDQIAGITTLITTNALGTLPDDENRYGPEMTADGRYVAYASQEPPGGGTNSSVYVWDSLADTNILVSTDGSGVPTNTISDTPVLSSDGRCVAFLSNATNLVGNVVSPGFHIYQRDLQSNTTQLVDADTNGMGSTDIEGTFPSMSADGQFVVFNAPDGSLVDGDWNNALDVFARDTIAGTNELISQTGPDTVSEVGNNITRMSPYSISGDGRWAVFESFADDLVPNDANGTCDVFLRDLWTGQTTLVSAGMDGNPALGGNSDSAAISADGRFVAFASAATNLTADTGTNINIFRRDIQTGTTILISTTTNFGVTVVMTNYSDPVISSDGRYVTFLSSAKTSSLPFGTFWRDANSTTAVLLGSSSSQFPPSMSADGRYVSYQTNQNQNSTVQLRIRDTQLGIDINTNLTAIMSAAISPDGSRLLYQTSANTVRADQIAPGVNLLSFVSTAPVQSSGQWSSDGRYVTFVGITNSENAVYLCDLVTSNITLVSFNATNSAVPNASSDMPVISGDGRFVTYRSYATDIVAGDTNPAPKIYLFDGLSGLNSIVSAAQTDSTPFPWISAPVISANANNVAFLSMGSDLVSDDLNRAPDAFATRVFFHIQLSPVVLPGGTTILTWQTVPMRTYGLQFKNNLNDSQWQDMSASISFIGNEGSVTVPADQPNRFYRIVESQ